MIRSVIKSYEELPLLLNAKQLAELMGVSISTAYELMRDEGFPTLKIGKRIVVPKEELRAWISEQVKGGVEG